MAPQREWFEKDYYAELGVSPSATEKDITRAYRKLAKQYHPDANKGNPEAEEKFKAISAAYDVLGTAEKRKEYDEVREMVSSGGYRGFDPNSSGGFSGFEGMQFDFGNGGADSGLGDILSGLFGGGNARTGGRRGRQQGGVAPQRGDDLQTELTLNFEEAVHGVETSVRFTADAVCHTCNGSGAKPGTTPTTCPQCQGSGTIAINQGPFSFSEVCPTCGGRGVTIQDPCPTCKGRGIEHRERTVKVRIPAGVNDAQRIRIAGRGGVGAYGGPPGDLFVIVHVKPSSIFGRDGKNLTLHVPVTFTEAALGTQIKIPTLAEPVTVKVPAGTESGKTVRVRNQGIQTKKGTGDLLVTFDVAVPKKLNKEQRKAVETLGEVITENPRENLKV